jgi:hypothetical protein
MPQYPLRIRFKDIEHAYSLYHTFEPYSFDYVEGYSMKRDGPTHVMLLSVASDADLTRFTAACRSQSEVVDVLAITEEEFWDAPSNAV